MVQAAPYQVTKCKKTGCVKCDSLRLFSVKTYYIELDTPSGLRRAERLHPHVIMLTQATKTNVASQDGQLSSQK